MKQGYIPPAPENNVRQSTNKKRWVLLVILVMAAIVITIGVVLLFGGNNKTPPLNASVIVQKLVDAGLPIENIIVYNEQTDPNSLLGRPNSYTSKVSFADNRIEQFGTDPEGGTVEVFGSVADANARNAYVSKYSGSILGAYIYQSDKAIMRISYKLTPAQADAYYAVLKSK